MINEFKDLKKKFGEKRKTKLIKDGDALIAVRNASIRPNKELQKKQALEDLPKKGILVVEVNNQTKIINPKLIKKIKINENLELSKEIIPARLIMEIENRPKILAITRNGKVGVLQWEFSGQSPGSLEKFLPNGLEINEIITLLPLPNKKEYSLGLLTSDGRFKRIAIEEVLEMSNRSATILKLKNNVYLQSALLCKNDYYLLVVTNIGRILKLEIKEDIFPLMGKLAQGPIIMNLFPNESIRSSLCLTSNNDITLITKKGFLIKEKVSSLRTCKKGDLGVLKINLKENKSNYDEIIDSYETTNSVIVHTSDKRYGQISSTQINSLPYNKIQRKILALNSNEIIEKIIMVTNNINLG